MRSLTGDFFARIFPDFWDTIDPTDLVEDDHSMFGDPEVFRFLVNAISPQTIIEIGSWKGHSANFMADLCKANGLKTRIVCVDTFLGGPEHWLLPGQIETLYRKNGFPTIINRFLGNTIARGNQGSIFPLTINSSSAAGILKFFNQKADLIFVDGAHEFNDVKSDIELYFPLLTQRGVMFGDDYQYEPLANAVHHCAEKLGVQVAVSARKWVYVTESLPELPADYVIRTSFAGWIHP